MNGPLPPPLPAPDPSLLSGLRLVIFTLIFILISMALGAQPVPREADRTVEWYARNQWALDAVTDACRNDPGALRFTRDCVNADQARIVVAEREVRRNMGDLTPPTSPQYWLRRPTERAQQLAYCARMNAAQQARFYCDAARAGGPAPALKGPRT